MLPLVLVLTPCHLLLPFLLLLLVPIPIPDLFRVLYSPQMLLLLERLLLLSLFFACGLLLLRSVKMAEMLRLALVLPLLLALCLWAVLGLTQHWSRGLKQHCPLPHHLHVQS